MLVHTNKKEIHYLMEHYFNYDGIDMTKEIFVVAYGNFSNYLVSNFGNIKSLI